SPASTSATVIAPPTGVCNRSCGSASARCPRRWLDAGSARCEVSGHSSETGVRLQSPDSSRGLRMMSDPQQGARLRVSRREYIVARVAAEEKAAEVAATRGEAGAWHPAREAPQATTGDRWKDRFRA